MGDCAPGPKPDLSTTVPLALWTFGTSDSPPPKKISKKMSKKISKTPFGKLENFSKGGVGVGAGGLRSLAGGRGGWRRAQGCIGMGGCTPPPTLPGRPAYAYLLFPWRQVPGSMALVTDSNRPQPLWQSPPIAYLTASAAASELPSLLMHPWSSLHPFCTASTLFSSTCPLPLLREPPGATWGRPCRVLPGAHLPSPAPAGPPGAHP